MIIKRSIKKEEISQLPRVSFTGEITVIENEAEARTAIGYLTTFKVVGIDSETRPSFKKGQNHKVALLQIATSDRCFLFRLNKIGIPQELINFLENPAVFKVGLSLKDDFMMLRKRAKLQPRGVIELQEYVKEFEIQDQSLQKIYALLFSMKISKSQRLSNWDLPSLTQSQKIYAATDAWACLEIYQLLNQLKKTGKYEVEPVYPTIESEKTYDQL